MNDLFLQSVTLSRNEAFDTSYLKEIEALRSLKTLSFSRRITFFAGENGTGKSTLLEAIAIASGLNPEGGTKNYSFSTYDDYSGLAGSLRLSKGPIRPRQSYFLRAESFYNVASATMEKYNDDGLLPDYHAQSHGESFLSFIQRYDRPGLYLMDEPEAALSPQRQLTLLLHLVRTAEAGAQFLIATHSPILLAAPEAEILSFDDGEIHPVAYEETGSYRITKLFLENREGFLRELLRED
ncbi:MAG: AAA family ATPase [Eubacterium sp.]|nr:AAA family ATPase [Eubacterium sp.]